MASEDKQKWRVLVVDDEVLIRKLVVLALTKEGCECDMAEDGDQAWRLICERDYDAVVTDLAMPHRHGHSLAVELLKLPTRPLIVVFTGIVEPRLVKDLLVRGIDDIVFKPVDFGALAAKVRTLVERRSRLSSPMGASVPALNRVRGSQVSQEVFEQRILALTRIPAVSQSAVDVYRLTMAPRVGLPQVAASIRRDPALTVEILRLANSTFFNPSGKSIGDVDKAITRLGLKRVGELALTSAAFASFSQESIPYFPLQRVWRKCLAAGICQEILADQSGNAEDYQGLFCAAILQPMGRILLASAFPDVYSRLLEQAVAERTSLTELERQAFPESTGEVAARILASWGLPEEIYEVLRHTSKSFAALAGLNDIARKRVGMVKMAGLFGDLAVGQFEEWDFIDLPSPALLKDLKVQSIEALLKQSRQDVKRQDVSTHSDTPRSSEPLVSENSDAALAYYPMQHGGPDFIPHILACGDLDLEFVGDERCCEKQVILCNAVHVAPAQAIERLRNHGFADVTILTDAANAEALRCHGCVIPLPMSLGQLRSVCLAAQSRHVQRQQLSAAPTAAVDMLA